MSKALTSTYDFWRKNLNTIPKRWGAVLKNSIPGFDHDVVFLVGENKKRISCHKFILSVSSPVFQAMFSENSGRKGNVESSHHIEIPDIEYEAFQNLITYSYTGAMDFTVQDALGIMFAADKYDIPELRDYCANLLNNNLSIENVVSIYQSSTLLDDYKLRNNSKDFLINHFQEILKSPELLQLSADTFSKFIQLDEVCITTEVDLFNAAIRWAKHECEQKELEATTENLRGILCHVVKHIRFTLMTADDFATHVEPTGILSESSCFVMYKYFSLSEKNRHLVKDCPYNTTPRRKLLTIVFWDNDMQSLNPFWLPAKPSIIDERISIPKVANPSPLKPIDKLTSSSSLLSNPTNPKQILISARDRITPLRRNKPTEPFVDPFITKAARGTYQESVLITFTSGATQSIWLKSIGFVAAFGGNKTTIICCTLSDYNISTPSEEATIEVIPTPGEIYYATFKNPIKLEQRSTKVWNLSFEYLEGSPAILSDYGTIVKDIDSSQRVTVHHNGGQRIIAGMQFLTNAS